MNLQKIILILFVSVGILLTGCSEESTLRTDEIIEKVLAEDQNFQSYYAEAELKTYENNELIEHSIMEEKRSGEKVKVIMKNVQTGGEEILINDGKTMTAYDKIENKAMIVNDIETLEIPNRSPKENVITLLENLKGSHEYEYLGEEKVNDFHTHHIKLKAKEKNSLYGEIELWIDKKTWFIVKSINTSGSIRMESVYSIIDTTPKFSDNTFIISLPDDVKIMNLEAELNETEGTIEEAEEKLGQSFLVLNEENVKLDKVDITKRGGDINQSEITLTYIYEDDISEISLSIFPTPEEDEYAINHNMKIRGQNAEYMKEINAYTWDEEGLRYTLIIEEIGSTFSEEKVIKLTEGMVKSS